VNWNVSTALKHTLIWVVRDAPMIWPQQQSCKAYFVLNLHTVRDVAMKDPFSSFFIDPSVLWAPTMCTFSEISNNHASCSMINHVNTLMQLLHCLLSSFCQLKSTLPPATQTLLSQSQQGNLVWHHLQLSKGTERIAWPSFELLYVTNTSHHKQGTLLHI
jgi:hypothetical protein